MSRRSPQRPARVHPSAGASRIFEHLAWTEDLLTRNRTLADGFESQQMIDIDLPSPAAADVHSRLHAKVARPWTVMARSSWSAHHLQAEPHLECEQPKVTWLSANRRAERESKGEGRALDLKELEYVDPSTHWYYQHKAKAILAAVQRHAVEIDSVFDVGAGSGFFCQETIKIYPESTAYCIDPNYTKEQVGQRQGMRFVLAPPESAASLYLMIDVLEHVPDDRALVREYARDAQNGAIFAVSVPAFMSLWSPHDVFLEHYRRYTLRELVATLESSGLEVLESQYLFGSVFLPAWILRHLRRGGKPKSDLRPARPIVNAIVTSILNLESWLPRNKILGTSAFVLAKRRVNPQ